MTEDDGWDADAWIDAMAPVVGITVTDAQRPGVTAFLALAKTMADTLETADLDADQLAPAGVFTPEPVDP